MPLRAQAVENGRFNEHIPVNIGKMDSGLSNPLIEQTEEVTGISLSVDVFPELLLYLLDGLAL